jgi:hypothetical protein
MKLAVVVFVWCVRDVELAQRSIAGRPWIVHLVERLRRARSVSRVVVACSEGRDAIATLFDGDEVDVVETSDPMTAARDLAREYEGVALCPVTQLFADPVRLDAVASAPSAPARAFAVLSSEPGLSLTGGAFLEVLTRHGIPTGETRVNLVQAPSTTLPVPPDAPELRLETPGDFDWAVRAYEALLARDPSGSLDRIEDALADAGLGRFGFWDQIGPAPRTILTVRCVSQPLFEHLLRYLRRLGSVDIDVVCGAGAAEQTKALPGVRDVIPFDAPAFCVDALGTATLETIRARQYDLCVIPRREPSGRGFENVTPLGAASGARTAIWLDPLGAWGLLSGVSQGWDPSTWTPAPHEQAEAYRERARNAFAEFAPENPVVHGVSHTSADDVADALTPGFLDRVDENLVCRPINDNRDLPLDLAGALLFQLPATIALRQGLAKLESTALPWVAPLTALVDTLFTQMVNTAATNAPTPQGIAAPASVLETIERVAALVSSLVDREASVEPALSAEARS